MAFAVSPRTVWIELQTDIWYALTTQLERRDYVCRFFPIEKNCKVLLLFNSARSRTIGIRLPIRAIDRSL